MHNPLTSLLRTIIDHYNREELKTLCFELSVDYDELGDEHKSGKVRELILYLGRRRELERLLDALRQGRPEAFGAAGLDEVTVEALYDALPSWDAGDVPVPPAPSTPAWETVLECYRERVKALYSTVRVLGKPEPVSLAGIYTDVYLLKEPAAWHYIDPSASLEHARGQRQDGLALVKQLEDQQLVILGKPGAGKTTFLKHIVLQADEGKLGDSVPIFVYLREWAGDDLLDFLAVPFGGCGLADPAAFVERLLQTGCALLLFDGLDEVKEAERHDLITKLERFGRRYLNCHILLTCRNAATPYQFERARYVEVADFTDAQIQAFAANWFGEDTAKAKQFHRQMKRDKYLRDLGRTPLLLGMLCLTFDEQGAFPEKRTGLYRQALDTLLRQWDESRNIQRGAVRGAEIYHRLSLGRKHWMFVQIAYETFVQDETLIPQERLERLITDYLVKVPGAPARIDLDASAILQAIEAQHGVLVTHAKGVYAFAHSTFQEYYAACDVVARAEAGDAQAIPQLLVHVHEGRWREVILMVVSMLSNATAFFKHLIAVLDGLIQGDEKLVAFLTWAERKAASVDVFYKPAAVRAHYIACDLARASIRAYNLARGHDSSRDLASDLAYRLASDFTSDVDLDFALDLARARDLARGFTLTLALGLTLDHDLVPPCAGDLDLDLDCALNQAATLGLTGLHAELAALVPPADDAHPRAWHVFACKLQRIMIEHRDIGHDWDFTREQGETLTHYFTASRLLLTYLDMAQVTDRDAIEARLVRPPKHSGDGG